MVETAEMGEVTVKQPIALAAGRPTSPVSVDAPTLAWTTPGTHIVSRIAHRQEVRLILERLERDRYCVFVVLSQDPEDLLDAIFDAERELCAQFRGIPFDVRVMQPDPNWMDEDIRRDTICHYDRALFHGDQ